MRIIAGSARGRRLVGPRGAKTRPFTDRAKEAVFSSLGGAVAGAHVLDAYAGSGSLGLEALSRGAASATFVESSRRALDALVENVTAVGLGGTVVRRRVEDYLASPATTAYDLVFLDPPYDLPASDLDRVLGRLVAWLADGATVVVHRRAGTERPTPPPVLHLDDVRRYGDAEVLRYVKEAT